MGKASKQERLAKQQRKQEAAIMHFFDILVESMEAQSEASLALIRAMPAAKRLRATHTDRLDALAALSSQLFCWLTAISLEQKDNGDLELLIERDAEEDRECLVHGDECPLLEEAFGLMQDAE